MSRSALILAEEIQKKDPDLKTFININTCKDPEKIDPETLAPEKVDL